MYDVHFERWNLSSSIHLKLFSNKLNQWSRWPSNLKRNNLNLSFVTVQTLEFIKAFIQPLDAFWPWSRHSSIAHCLHIFCLNTFIFIYYCTLVGSTLSCSNKVRSLKIESGHKAHAYTPTGKCISNHYDYWRSWCRRWNVNPSKHICIPFFAMSYIFTLELRLNAMETCDFLLSISTISYHRPT